MVTDSVSPRAWDSRKRARARSLYWHSRQAVRRALQLSVLGVTPCCCMRFHIPMALSTCCACTAARGLTQRMVGMVGMTTAAGVTGILSVLWTPNANFMCIHHTDHDNLLHSAHIPENSLSMQIC